MSIKIGIGFGGGRLGLPTPEQVCGFAERAEDLGIDSIWLSDRISSRQPHLDIACVMAMFAARTKRIKMGPSVLTLPARDPVQVARTYATLDYLTGSCGRVIMAVGLGSDPKECLACGIAPEERGARMEEGVAVMRRLWAEERVSHHGRFYNFDEVSIAPRPLRGGLDVWIGGRSDIAIKRTARYGNGWFPSFITPSEFKSGMAKLQEYASGYGRTVDRREAGVVLLTHITDDAAQAEQLKELVARGLPANATGEGSRVAVGPAEVCVAQIREYVDAGCTKFVLFPLAPPDQLIAQIERFGQQIIPRFA